MLWMHPGAHFCVGTETVPLLCQQHNYFLNVGTYLGASASGGAPSRGRSPTCQSLIYFWGAYLPCIWLCASYPTTPPILCSGRALCRPTRSEHSTTCKCILTNTDIQGCWPAQGTATTTADYRKKNDYMEQKSQILTCPLCCQHVRKCGMIMPDSHPEITSIRSLVEAHSFVTPGQGAERPQPGELGEQGKSASKRLTSIYDAHNHRTLPNRTAPRIHCSGRALCRPTRSVHSTT